MAYKDKLKDPRWQKKRLEILDRDEWTCQDCGAKDKTLHVHHTLYVKGQEPWEYDGYFLKTLCEECHERIELCKDDRELIISYFFHAVSGRDVWKLSEIIQTNPELFRDFLKLFIKTYARGVVMGLEYNS